MTIEEPSLRHPQHLKYWLRCFKTLIPSHYTSADSSRLSLVYFTISALDILGYEFSQLDRSNSIAWIYSLQHPKGGFRSSPSIDLSPPYLCIGQIPSDERGRWDQPDLPGTFFALICLGILRDDFRRLERIHCLHWLRSLQRTDGSFGDFLGPDGQIAGGADSRFSYFAAAVRWILRPQPGHDIKARDLQRWVLDSETYEHGFSETKYHEAHAGFTYCALAALALLEHSSFTRITVFKLPAISNPGQTINWLLKRQTAQPDCPSLNGQQPSEEQTPRSSSPKPGYRTPGSAGFNGRCGKSADTCYSFWVGASLLILDARERSNSALDQRFLLERTQHFIGGFGKLPEDKPDILHSYLGLVALALPAGTASCPLLLHHVPDQHKHAVPKPVDPVLCVSRSTTDWLRDAIQEESLSVQL